MDSSDEDLVYAEVIKDGRNCKKIVLASYCIQYASERLRDDLCVLFAATQKSHMALSYASLNLQNNRDIVIAVIKINPYL